MRTTVLPFKVERLGPALGARITGIDLSGEINKATFDALRQAWLDHIVVVFPGQSLDETQQERFCRGFGELETVRSNMFQDAAHPSIMLITNVRDTGKVTALEEGEMFFHSDQCYYELPADATVLYAMEVPPTGGNTLFANCCAAYEALPAETKKRIAGQRALNYYDYKRDPMFRPTELNPDAPRWTHPVVRTHPETGRKALYANRLMTIAIEGMDPAESDALLGELFDHVERPEFVYEHAWTVGDVIMWDNRCSMHARRDFDAGQRRMMRRVTVKGTAPVA